MTRKPPKHLKISPMTISIRKRNEKIISFVVPCKARLSSLKKTIKSVLAQPKSDYIFVDCNCPEESGNWLKTTFPERINKDIHIINFNEPELNISRARNFGGRFVKTPWICFLDIDIQIMCNFTNLLPQTNEFLISDNRSGGLAGFVCCRTSDFIKSGGYDESFRGFGREDCDFLYNLYMNLGINFIRFNHHILYHHPHNNKFKYRHNNFIINDQKMIKKWGSKTFIC